MAINIGGFDGTHGGNMNPWDLNPKLNAGFIKKNRLASAGIKFIDPGIRGGNRLHLHFNGEVYYLNDKQWAEYSKYAIKECTQLLAKANAVSFEQALILGSISQSIAKGRK